MRDEKRSTADAALKRLRWSRRDEADRAAAIVDDDGAVKKMRIWHEGAVLTTFMLNGVNAAVWLLAREQAALGHDVALLLCDPPNPEALQKAAEAKVRLLHVPATNWGYDRAQLSALLSASAPDLIHMHSVFIRRQFTLAATLHRRGVPYLVTPHGGFAPTILRRHSISKRLYRSIFESRRCRGAVTIAASTGEAREVRDFVGHHVSVTEHLPIPIDASALEGAKWRGDLDARRLVFLGRFDVYVKGLDRLVAIASRMPGWNFHLHGSADTKTERVFNRLKRQAPGNVRFCEPVFGADKARVLADASAYIQTSRCESFGMSIAEAMYVGVPCAVSTGIHMASTFEREQLGLRLSEDSVRAADALELLLNDRARLQQFSAAGAIFARDYFMPDYAARQYVELYRQLLDKKEDTALKGSVSSGGEKMRRDTQRVPV